MPSVLSGSPILYAPSWTVLKLTRQKLEALGRAALPPSIGDVKVNLDWPGYPLVAVLRDSQGQRHLGRRRGTGSLLGSGTSFFKPPPFLLPPSPSAQEPSSSLKKNPLQPSGQAFFDAVCMARREWGGSGGHNPGTELRYSRLLLLPTPQEVSPGTSLLCTLFTVASSSHCSFPSVQETRALSPTPGSSPPTSCPRLPSKHSPQRSHCM